MVTVVAVCLQQAHKLLDYKISVKFRTICSHKELFKCTDSQRNPVL